LNELVESGENMNDFLKVGKIINAHGIKGEVKIFPLTDDVNRFYYLKKVYIEQENAILPLTISNIRIHKNVVLATFNEIKNRNQAEKYKGLFININREDAIELSKDQYFISDLIGLKVYSIEGVLIGNIKEILQTGPTDIYVIETDNKDILVPALKDIFKEIDIHKKTAKANIPKDLMDL
jgi:16S rRNA processing protein RimM